MRECQGCLLYASALEAKPHMPVCAHALASDVLHDVHTKSRYLDQSSPTSPTRMLYACRARRSGCCVHSCSTREKPAKNWVCPSQLYLAKSCGGYDISNQCTQSFRRTDGSRLRAPSRWAGGASAGSPRLARPRLGAAGSTAAAVAKPAAPALMPTATTAPPAAAAPTA